MRFVPTYCLRNGMILGDNLYGRSGELMLTKGTVLKDDFRNSIIRLKFNGVYIDDEESKDIEIINIIEENLRAETIKGVKNIFVCAENKKNPKIEVLKIQKQVESIITEVLNNKHLMVNMVDIKVFDEYIYSHSVNVSVLSIVMGVALNLDKKDLYNLCLSALLHDIGKIFIPKEILDKKDQLTAAEFEEIKKHSELGADYVRKTLKLPAMVTVAIMDHHEKFDGSGYPSNRKANSISLLGKIIALADVYDALTSDRPYRKAMQPLEALEYIMGAYCTHFDPELVVIFMRKVAPYPIGTTIRLSNGYVGIVTKNYEEICLRPTVRILKIDDEAVEPFEIHLKNKEYINVTISEIV